MVDISKKNFGVAEQDMRTKQLLGLPDNLAVIASERRRK